MQNDVLRMSFKRVEYVTSINLRLSHVCPVKRIPRFGTSKSKSGNPNKTVSRQCITVFVWINLEKAFDKVWLNFHSSTILLIKFYLGHRTFRVKVLNKIFFLKKKCCHDSPKVPYSLIYK